MGKLIKKFFQTSAGFTLIELLVVIGILGILASALVATIDPFEQLNKAQDANLKNVTVEFLNANIRYYTTHNALPWDLVANGGADCRNGQATPDNPSQIALNTINTCLTTLVSEGEIKQGFTSFTGLNKIFLTEPNPQTNNNNEMVACFMPQSRSQQKDPNTKYTISGALAAVDFCKSDPPGTNNCYWCSQ